MGDPRALQPPSAEFIASVTRAQRVLHAFISSIVRHAADADDVLQETNVVLWQKAAEFDSSREFMPWAMRVAQLQSLAFLKKKHSSRLTFPEELLTQIADEAIAEVGDSDARRVALAGCLQKLSEPQRLLIARRYQPGGSVKAMSEERGMTPKALSELLRRLRRNLLLCIEGTLAGEAGA